MNARVSIVLCTYNGEKYLRSQLDSILSQTYPIHELIIQDDCSIDGTPDIIKEYAEKNPIIKTYFNNQNLGFKNNFSDAVSKASGDYIALSDQDDIWLDNHIQVLAEIIGNRSIASADSRFIDNQGNDLGYTISQEKQMLHFYENGIECAFRLFYNSGFFHGHNMLLRADFAKKCLPIPDDIVYHDIWFTALACFQDGIVYSDTIISLYRQHQHTVTSHRRYNILRDLKMRHHNDFSDNRIELYLQLVKRKDLSSEGYKFLEEFRRYAIRCPFLKNRLWCWWWRFSHYRLIYTTKNLKYFFPRSLQYIITPSFIKKSDISKLME